MIISYAFLKEILKAQCPQVSSLAEKLISIGFEVEEIIPGLQNHVSTVKVTHVVKIENSELFLVTVTDSIDTFTVVTSWTKIKVNEIYIHAKPGVEIADTILTQKQFDTVESFGMLLSYKELLLNPDILLTSEKEGLLKLPDDTPLGMNFYDLFWLSDPWFNLKIPYNRPDCYSFLGLLREIICAFEISCPLSVKRDIHLLYPSFSEKMLKRTVARSDFKKIEILNKTSCPFYSGIILENVVIGESPFEIRKRLFSFYIKPINNVVDIANLLMFYFGQPLHTFDFDKIIGKQILIRDAKPGETLEALDDKTYSLENQDLVIADEIHSIALAGMIGGKDSEIKSTTQNIFIESAFFSPVTISQTSNRLNFVTDASNRFSRGVEQNQVREICIFASYLISSICGGTIAGEVLQDGSLSYKAREISFTLQDFTNITGLEISKYTATHILGNLGIPFEIKSQDIIVVKVPSFRDNDLKETVDIIEEILRFVGYDKILPKPPQYTISFQPENDLVQSKSIIYSQLLGLGFQEIITDSIVLDEEVELFYPQDQNELFRISNPLKSGLSFLSPNKLIQFMKVIKTNISRKQSLLRFFEIGKHYLKEEKEHLNIALTGNMDLDSWYQKTKIIDFFYAKGVIESFLEHFSIPYQEKKSIFYQLFDCEESLDFYVGAHRIGSLGLVHSKIMNYYEITQPIYFAFFSLPLLQKYLTKEVHYKKISNLQDVSRDIAFTVSKSVRTRNIVEKIQDFCQEILKDVIVFDVYIGPNIDESLKSIAIRLVFNYGENVSKERIQETMDQIVIELEKSFQISIRK